MAKEEYSDLELKPSTLENIDTALYRFLDEALNLHANTTDGNIKVPVIFASAERAFLSKNSAEGRDDDGNSIQVVQDDLQLICFDAVSEPSSPGAYVMDGQNGGVKLHMSESTTKEFFTKGDKISRVLNEILRGQK